MKFNTPDGSVWSIWGHAVFEMSALTLLLMQSHYKIPSFFWRPFRDLGTWLVLSTPTTQLNTSQYKQYDQLLFWHNIHVLVLILCIDMSVRECVWALGVAFVYKGSTDRFSLLPPPPKKKKINGSPAHTQTHRIHDVSRAECSQWRSSFPHFTWIPCLFSRSSHATGSLVCARTILIRATQIFNWSLGAI